MLRIINKKLFTTTRSILKNVGNKGDQISKNILKSVILTGNILKDDTVNILESSNKPDDSTLETKSKSNNTGMNSKNETRDQIKNEGNTIVSKVKTSIPFSEVIKSNNIERLIIEKENEFNKQKETKIDHHLNNQKTCTEVTNESKKIENNNNRGATLQLKHKYNNEKKVIKNETNLNVNQNSSIVSKFKDSIPLSKVTENTNSKPLIIKNKEELKIQRKNKFVNQPTNLDPKRIVRNDSKKNSKIDSNADFKNIKITNIFKNEKTMGIDNNTTDRSVKDKNISVNFQNVKDIIKNNIDETSIKKEENNQLTTTIKDDFDCIPKLLSQDKEIMDDWTDFPKDFDSGMKNEVEKLLLFKDIAFLLDGTIWHNSIHPLVDGKKIDLKVNLPIISGDTTYIHDITTFDTKVVAEFPIDMISLEPYALEVFKVLCGPRYNEKTKKIKISEDRYNKRIYNHKRICDLIRNLVEKSIEISKEDMENEQQQIQT